VTAPVVLDHRASGYSLRHAYCLAQACALAYKDPVTIEQQAATWGFDRVRHHETRFTPPFPLQDTQACTLAGDHMIITAFRGTESDQIKDWLTDGTAPPRRGRTARGVAPATAPVLPPPRP
jgi:hypothetical protein